MHHSNANTASYKIISKHDICNVVFNEKTMQHALRAARPIANGEIISSFSAKEILNEPSFLSIQTGIEKHILLDPEFLQYTNHSCEPNVFFDTTKMEQVALRDIEEGEELCFFYPSTEWEMTQSFDCFCGHTACLGEIKGAAFLNEAARKKYRFTDYIQDMLNKHKKENKKVA